MDKKFKDKVAIITGAGNGLGKSHAKLLASLGAKVVINDIGSDRSGQGQSAEAANAVVEEIRSAGGEAIHHNANVSRPDEVQDMVEKTMSTWGRVDILVNNAGILRDKSFSKITLEEIKSVIDVHLMGSFICCKAVWDIMCEQKYGRIVMTTSGSGLYGNFGQSNYAAAKLGVIGLMNTLGIEGEKYDIKANALAPAAGTRMTKELIPKEIFEMMTPESVSPGLVLLCAEDAPSRKILCAGGGSFSNAVIYESSPVFVSPEELSSNSIEHASKAIFDDTELTDLASANDQSLRFAKIAMAQNGIG